MFDGLVVAGYSSGEQAVNKVENYTDTDYRNDVVPTLCQAHKQAPARLLFERVTAFWPVVRGVTPVRLKSFGQILFDRVASAWL